jgi:hypothetical protein
VHDLVQSHKVDHLPHGALRVVAEVALREHPREVPQNHRKHRQRRLLQARNRVRVRLGKNIGHVMRQELIHVAGRKRFAVIDGARAREKKEFPIEDSYVG